ncbi:MAG: hypothetical protein KAI47_11695 [Deltaproteobacteria bacterium]|nr:hypothetical protein [Deltaproteobacteria bacterium]
MLTTRQRELLFSQVMAAPKPAPGPLRETSWPWTPTQLVEAGDHLTTSLQRAGADEIAFESYPWGPEAQYQGWSGVRRPLVAEAELWLLDGDHERLLCRASDDAGSCLGTLASTEPDGDVFEVVNVGFGTSPGDYRRQRVGGKIALASGHRPKAAMVEALLSRDAAGLLLGPGAASTRRDQRFDDAILDAPRRPFGFNLDAERYHLLLTRLAAGDDVRVRVRTQVRSESGERPVVLARLLGAEKADEHVSLVIDLSRGFAGVAAGLRILHALRATIVADVLRPPARSIEIALIGGDAGAVAWLAREHATVPRALLQLDLPDIPSDMASLHPILPGGPSFFIDLLADEFEALNELDDPLGDHHTLDITTQNSAAQHALALDGTTDEAAVISCAPGTPTATTSWNRDRIIAATAATLYRAANLADSDIPSLIAAGELAARARLETRARSLRRRILHHLHGDVAEQCAQARDLLWQSAHGLQRDALREQDRLSSATRFFGGAGGEAMLLIEANAAIDRDVERLLRVLTAELRGRFGEGSKLARHRKPLTAAERRAQGLVIRRAHDGPIPLALLQRDALPQDRTWLVHHEEDLATSAQPARVLDHLGDAVDLLELWERLRLDTPSLDLKLLGRLVEVLEHAGIVYVAR